MFLGSGTIINSDSQLKLEDGTGAEKAFTATTGEIYTVSFDITDETSMPEKVQIMDASSNSTVFDEYDITGVGPYTFIFKAEQSSLKIRFKTTGNNNSFLVDNVKIGNNERSIADITSAQDYYPFGMVMPGRMLNTGDNYRYGFNGYENDNEIKGGSNSIDYTARIYDSRLGRFNSLDRVGTAFPYWSPDHFAGNTPIMAFDLDGYQPVKGTTTVGGKEYKFKISRRKAQHFYINGEKFDFTSDRKTGGNSLKVFKSKSSYQIQDELRKSGRGYKYSDVEKLLNTDVHDGILVTELLENLLLDNPHIELVIVGNHNITTTFYTPSGTVKFAKGTVPEDFHIDFTTTRAQTASDYFFPDASPIILKESAYTVKSSDFAGFRFKKAGADAQGVTILFKNEPVVKKVVKKIINFFRRPQRHKTVRFL